MKPKTRVTPGCYSAEVRGLVRAEYETGNYSVKSLPSRIRYGIHARTVEGWVEKYRWQKGSSAPTIEKAQAELNLDRFTRAGLPPDRLIERVIEGVNAGSECVEEVVTIIRENKGELDPKAVRALHEIGTALNSRAKFVDIYCKMTGQYAPTKTQDLTPPAPQKAPDLSRFSDEELRQWEKLWEKAGANPGTN